jgi:hypothetical protein
MLATTKMMAAKDADYGRIAGSGVRQPKGSGRPVSAVTGVSRWSG